MQSCVNREKAEFFKEGLSGLLLKPGASQFLSDQGGGLYLARAEEEDRTKKMHTFQIIKEDSRSRPKIPTDIQGTIEKTERQKRPQ